MSIRPYEPPDCDAVMRAWESATRQSAPFLTEEFIRGEREEVRTKWIPAADIWVYEHDGSVVGFIALLGDEVGGFFVQPVQQGQGVGRALMDHARRLRGRLELDVFTENSIGRRFYQRYGFRIVGEHVHEATGRSQLRLRLGP